MLGKVVLEEWVPSPGGVCEEQPHRGTRDVMRRRSANWYAERLYLFVPCARLLAWGSCLVDVTISRAA